MSVSLPLLFFLPLPSRVLAVNENLNLAINAAKSIGLTVVNIGAGDLIEGRPHLVLGLVWQLVKLCLLSKINLKSNPNLIRMLQEGETLEQLLKLPPEKLLLRWLNHHLVLVTRARTLALSCCCAGCTTIWYSACFALMCLCLALPFDSSFDSALTRLDLTCDLTRHDLLNTQEISSRASPRARLSLQCPSANICLPTCSPTTLTYVPG